MKIELHGYRSNYRQAGLALGLGGAATVTYLLLAALRPSLHLPMGKLAHRQWRWITVSSISGGVALIGINPLKRANLKDRAEELYAERASLRNSPASEAKRERLKQIRRELDELRVNAALTDIPFPRDPKIPDPKKYVPEPTEERELHFELMPLQQQVAILEQEVVFLTRHLAALRDSDALRTLEYAIEERFESKEAPDTFSLDKAEPADLKESLLKRFDELQKETDELKKKIQEYLNPFHAAERIRLFELKRKHEESMRLLSDQSVQLSREDKENLKKISVSFADSLICFRKMSKKPDDEVRGLFSASASYLKQIKNEKANESLPTPPKHPGYDNAQDLAEYLDLQWKYTRELEEIWEGLSKASTPLS